MPFQLYTVNHLTHEISQVAAAADLAQARVPEWQDMTGVHSLVSLVTCNRVEIYVSADPDVRLLPTFEITPHAVAREQGSHNAAAAGEGVKKRQGFAVLAEAPNAPATSSAGMLRATDDTPAVGIPLSTATTESPLTWNYLEGRAVAEHLFRVASGLDSMVVGEAEVAGQVRRAFTTALDQGTVKGLMIKMFEGALTTSRRVATHTELTGLGRSVVSVALDLAAADLSPMLHEEPSAKSAVTQTSKLDVVDENLADNQAWQGVRALLVGTGAYAGTAVAQLRARGVRDIANIQTSRRVVSFASIHRTRVVEAEDTITALSQADLVIACRGLGSPVLRASQIAAATKNRRRPLVILDLALHADVEPSVHALPGVKLWNLEDIRSHVPALAVSQIQRANELVEEGLTDYDAAVAGRHMDPVIVRLRALFEAAARDEIAALPPGDAIPREEVERAIWHVVKKLAHTPSVSAHLAAESGMGAQWVDALATVWGLTPEVLEDAFSG